MRRNLRHLATVVISCAIGMSPAAARAQASEAGLATSLGVGLGWTRTSYRGSGERVALSGVALDLRFAVGHRATDRELMFCGGVLVAPHLESSALSHPTERLWLPHLGACAALRPLATRALTFGARLELAEGVISGPNNFIDGIAQEAILTTATGGVFGLSASYAPVTGQARSLIVGFELLGGYLRRHDRDVEPVTGLLFAEARWP